MIIYAPIVELTTAAFAGTTLRVEFKHNPAVGFSEVTSMYCKIVQHLLSGKEETIINELEVGNENFDLEAGQVSFEIPEGLLSEKQYYKIQIAYGDSSGIGPWSYASIAKYLGEEPILKVNLWEANQTTYENTRHYYGSAEITEAVKIYQFTLTEGSNLIYDSGEIFTQSSQSVYDCLIKNELEQNITYLLTFSITTINGYQASVSYYIKANTSDDVLISGNLYLSQVKDAYDNGYVQIAINDIEQDGAYQLLRSIDLNVWDTLTNFELFQEINSFNFKDFTVEHGIQYYYAIRRYWKETSTSFYSYSTPQLISAITAELESVFLADESRQLKLAFNTNVSSFKDTILESKVDTIGSKYPFIFRNGNVRYKEIPISGLLSYLLDTNYFFSNKESLGIDKDWVPTTNLTGQNITIERKFKLQVLNWLNNGQPKLFRSPTEGNYVIRMMNVSLSPEKTLGRMLHSFNATGYEIGDSDWDNLLKEKLVFQVGNFEADEDAVLTKRIITQLNGGETINNLQNINYLFLKNNSSDSAEIVIIGNEQISIAANALLLYQDYVQADTLTLGSNVVAILDAEVIE